jgi:hypothetical protein
LVNEGPISIAIDAAHKSFVFYSSGVFYGIYLIFSDFEILFVLFFFNFFLFKIQEPDCKNKPDDLDHAVLLVGYGTLFGEPYWLVKNSWSTYWGNDGYVLMSQKDNNCGVTTQTTYPIVV